MLKPSQTRMGHSECVVLGSGTQAHTATQQRFQNSNMQHCQLNVLPLLRGLRVRYITGASCWEFSGILARQLSALGLRKRPAQRRFNPKSNAPLLFTMQVHVRQVINILYYLARQR